MQVSFVWLADDSLSADDVVRLVDGWKVSQPGGLNRGVRNEGVLWIRVFIEDAGYASGGLSHVFWLNNTFLKAVDIYVFEPDHGRWYPCWSRDSSISWLPLMYPHCILKAGSTDFLIKIVSETALHVPLYVDNLSAFIEKQANDRASYLAFVGGMFLLLLLSIVAAIYLDKRLFWLYALYLLGGLASLTFSSNVLPWASYIAFEDLEKLVGVSSGIWMLGAAWFIYQFFDGSGLTSWMKRALKAYAFFGILACTLVWLLPFGVFSWLVGLVAWAMSGLIAYIAWWVWQRKGHADALYFFIGWFSYVIFLTIYMLAELLGLFTQQLWGVYWLELALLLENIFLAIALFTYYRRRYTFAVEQQLLLEREKTDLQRNINDRLQHLLHEQLQAMQQQKEEIEAQNEELLQQSLQLSEQNRLIENQLEEIRMFNDDLQRRVDERTLELQRVNDALLRYTQQVEDYAFALAHNLRAPLARIMGLAHLLEQPGQPHEQMSIYQAMARAAKDADLVLKDLNEIISIRGQGIVPVRLVAVEPLVRRVLNVIERTYQIGYQLYPVYREPLLPANEAYLEDILLRLFDNAFRYRNPAHELQLHIVVEKEDDEWFVFRIEDNGMGLDTNQYAAKLWHPYQTFHSISGRGISLYLIKVKMEAIAGNVRIEGKRMKGVRVDLLFPVKK